MHIQLKSIGELAATLAAGTIALNTRNPMVKGAATLAAAALTVHVWWRNQPITEAAVQGQQMIDSIKTAQRYGNAEDMPDGPAPVAAGVDGTYMAGDDAYADADADADADAWE
jgi:hypothetical protein